MFKNKTKISLIISLAACILSIVMLVTVCFAWFAFNSNVNVGGLDFVTSTSKISFGDKLVSVRKLDGREDITQEYSLTEGNYIDADGNAFSLTGILPGETIEISLNLVAEMLTENFSLELGFGGVHGDVFTFEEKEYSVLGVFCVYPYSYNAESLEFEIGERKWLYDYSDTNSNPNDTVSFMIVTDDWQNYCLNEDGSRTFKFQIALDLEQYREQGISQSNLLSQKTFEIESVYAWVML